MTKDILLIKAGGTVCQKRNEHNILYVPKKQEYLHLIPNIQHFANISDKEIDPIDSTNMNFDDRKKIANIIKKNHKHYDGFIIIQGTDTLADSAIAMNYMIQNLQKPIIFTGSQIPIYEKNNDAIKNITDSINVATTELQGSMIVFDGKIIEGSRAVKRHSEDLFAFYSPRSPLIGEIKNNKIELLQKKKNITRKLSPRLFLNFNPNVYYHHQISGANTKILEKIVESEDVSGIVIGGYGTGNINSNYLNAIEKSTNYHKPIAIITGCQYGRTNPKYSVGAEAIEKGAFLGYDLTKESATQKMMYALGLAKKEKTKKENLVKRVKEIIQTPIGNDMIIND